MEELFEQIIYQAIKKNVSDIHLQCTEKGVIKFRICGELLTYETYEKTNIIQLMNYIRFISKIDLNYYRKPQTRHYVYVLNNKKYNLRISSLIGKDMDSIVIRILNNHQKLSLEKDVYKRQGLINATISSFSFNISLRGIKICFKEIKETSIEMCIRDRMNGEKVYNYAKKLMDE